MADSPVGSLPLAEVIDTDDLFVLEQDGTAKKLQGATLTDYLNRNLLDVSVYSLDYTQTPQVSYDRITGHMSLGIPKGNSIVSASVNSNNRLVFTWADGTTITCGTVKGDTGKSAYDYAVERGYTGTETSFAELQYNLYLASQNENERVVAEQQRQTNYTYMMNQVQEKLDNFDMLLEYSDMAVTGTTLIVNRIGVTVVDTTILF